MSSLIIIPVCVSAVAGVGVGAGAGAAACYFILKAFRVLENPHKKGTNERIHSKATQIELKKVFHFSTFYFSYWNVSKERERQYKFNI